MVDMDYLMCDTYRYTNYLLCDFICIWTLKEGFCFMKYDTPGFALIMEPFDLNMRCHNNDIYYHIPSGNQNMAMENGPFVSDVPSKTSIHGECSSQPCLITRGYIMISQL